jgi:hypothetical protein
MASISSSSKSGVEASSSLAETTWLGVYVVLLVDLQVQGSFVDGLEASVGALHDFRPDRFMDPSNEEPGLEELPDGNFGIFPVLLVVVSPDGLRHVIGFACHEPL